MEFLIWLVFFVVVWVISLFFGVGVIVVMMFGLNYGFCCGYFMIFGLVLGIMMQIVVVGVGFGVLIVVFLLVFMLVKWSGVVYLVWLGIQQWCVFVVLMVVVVDLVDVLKVVICCQLVMWGWFINVVNFKGMVFLLVVVL